MDKTSDKHADSSIAQEDIMTFLKWNLTSTVCGKGVPFTNTGGSGGCYIDDALGIASMQRLQAMSTTWVPVTIFVDERTLC